MRSTSKSSLAAVALVAIGILCAAIVHKPSHAARTDGVHPAAPVETPSASPAAVNVPPPSPAATKLAALGRAIFFDRGMSTPRGTSCASCHDPAQGFAGNNGSTSGVARGSRPGHFARRNTPSVRYLKFVRAFHFHWEEDAPVPDAVGGFFWDGRADSMASLVEQPLLNPDEMGNPGAPSIAKAIHESSYAADFDAAFGGSLTAEQTLHNLGVAIEAFLTSDEMAPFSSKYDDFLRGRATLSSLESEGLRLFKDAEKGNCATCHKLNDRSPDPRRSLFTDYGFEVVGVPRNRRLPASTTRGSVDLGLCDRQGAAVPAKEDRLCSSFRTPSLRNVALRKAFMHNGYFSNLRDVVTFYATRDTNPERWYPRGVAYDDMPAKNREFVNTGMPPYDRARGAEPRLNPHDVDAIVAFLETLTDAPDSRTRNP